MTLIAPKAVILGTRVPIDRVRRSAHPTFSSNDATITLMVWPDVLKEGGGNHVSIPDTIVTSPT